MQYSFSTDPNRQAVTRLISDEIFAADPRLSTLIFQKGFVPHNSITLKRKIFTLNDSHSTKIMHILCYVVRYRLNHAIVPVLVKHLRMSEMTSIEMHIYKFYAFSEKN